MAIQTVRAEVNTKVDGKQKSTSVDVAQFDYLEDAVEYFTAEDAEDPSAARAAAEEAVVALVNAQHKTNEQNSARQGLKSKSPYTELRRRAETDPQAQAMFDELCRKLDIEI